MPAGPVPRISLFGRLGYYVLLVYLFLYLSRLFEWMPPYLRTALVLNVVFLGLAVLSGGLGRASRSRICWLLAAFYTWMMLSFPFSVWKGGSVATMILAARSLTLMVAIVALVWSTRDCLRLMYVTGLAAVTAGLMSVATGQQERAGRLIVAVGETAMGTFADPNLYCALLYMGLPFLWLAARNASSRLLKLVCLAATAPVLAAGVATGSRMGLITLCVMLGLLFLRLPAARKMRLALAAGTVLVVAALTLSDYLLQRYTTFFRVEQPAGLSAAELGYLGASVESSEGRLRLLRRSLAQTFQHPLLGVGPGMFNVAEEAAARAQGLPRASSHRTHNAYTQVSSEAGIPAFLFFTTALFLSLRALWGLRKALTPPASREQERARNAATYLEVSFAGMLTTAVFLSIAYDGLLYVLAGLTVALERAVRQEHLGRAPAARPAMNT